MLLVLDRKRCEGILVAAIAFVLGFLVGTLGFAPLLVARRLSLHRRSVANDLSITLGLGCLLVSFVFLAVALLVAAKVAADVFPFFGIALVVAFLVNCSLLAIWLTISYRRGRRL